MKEAFLFMPHVFTKVQLKFLKDNFPNRFDCFVIRLCNDTFPKIEEAIEVNCTSKKEYRKAIFEVLEKYDVVYLVPSFFSPGLKLYFWLFHRNLIKKIVWIEWGYDLYLTKGVSIIGYLKYLGKRIAQLTFERSIPYFVAIHPVDITEYHKRIRGKAIILYAPYRFSVEQDSDLLNYEKISISDKIKQGLPLYVQINNCIESGMNHIDILRRLRKFADENIRIVLPMAYGNFSYMPVVEEYANKCFPGKVICWKDYVSYDEYKKRISQIDIFILGVARQRALGNIHSFMYMQKKIFLPSNSQLYRYYQENNISIYKLDDLDVMDFSDLCSDDDLSSEREYVLSLYSESPLVQWKRVFDYIKNNFNNK